MSASALAFVILTPFAGIFAYATWHEYRRYKDEGSSSYGLTYDPETNTTHVGAMAEDEESYDPARSSPTSSRPRRRRPTPKAAPKPRRTPITQMQMTATRTAGHDR